MVANWLNSEIFNFSIIRRKIVVSSHTCSIIRLYRPHCGGRNFKVVGIPKTIKDYYNFHKPNAKAYECLCPSGFTGDKCELCPSGNGTYRYQIGDIVCEDCGCSDLSLSEECDRSTGQCSCGDDIDVKLAGRQCVSVSASTNCSHNYIL